MPFLTKPCFFNTLLCVLRLHVSYITFNYERFPLIKFYKDVKGN